MGGIGERGKVERAITMANDGELGAGRRLSTTTTTTILTKFEEEVFGAPIVLLRSERVVDRPHT
jgi:hypothetical protein